MKLKITIGDQVAIWSMVQCMLPEDLFEPGTTPEKQSEIIAGAIGDASLALMRLKAHVSEHPVEFSDGDGRYFVSFDGDDWFWGT